MNSFINPLNRLLSTQLILIWYLKHEKVEHTTTMSNTSKIEYLVANESHTKYASEVSRMMEVAARQRGTGISKRPPEVIAQKMRDGKAIIALDGDKIVGFCYVEAWEQRKFVSHSGLIVHPDYRGGGIAKKIKTMAFELARQKYPEAKIFGITTSPAVLKINSDLGYRPVAFSELTKDEAFWEGCESCVNHDILTRTERKMCLCTGMLYDPQQKEKPKSLFLGLLERFQRFKTSVLFKKFGVKPDDGKSEEEFKLSELPEIKEQQARKKEREELSKIYF
ncbi:MAG: GNAT family N-acetyltransferase [Flammeovirgaceae bacterium]|nr:GNAT family N-acetyltransferase [Flammeovirgaceae bacterium]